MATFRMESSKKLVVVDPNLGIQYEDGVIRVILQISTGISGIVLADSAVSLLLENYNLLAPDGVPVTTIGGYLDYTYTLTSQYTQKFGTVSVQACISYQALRVRSEIAYGIISRSQSAGDAPAALYPGILEQVQTYRDQAMGYADDADESATLVQTASTEAQAASTLAQTAKDNAQTYSGQALAYRDTAGGYANDAQSANTNAQTAKTDAQGYASQAQTLYNEWAAKDSKAGLLEEFYVNVKDFGAVGDGSTDDTTALSTAITYATSHNCGVYLPQGTYRKTADLVIGTALKIVGAGVGRTILLDTRASGAACIRLDVDGCYLSDFSLRSSTGGLTAGIRINNVYQKGTALERLVIGDCNSHGPHWGFGIGLHVYTSRYVKVRDCVIGDNVNGVQIDMISSPLQEPNVIAFYSTDIEHNENYGIFCNSIPNGPVFFGGTFQYNGLAFYSKCTNNQIKLYETYLEANGFYVEGGYNAVLHLGNLGQAIAAQSHIVRNVQGVSLKGFISSPAQTDYSGAEGIYLDPNCSYVSFEGFETVEYNGLSNGGFEDATYNTGWTTVRATISDETTDFVEGEHSCKVTANDSSGVGSSGLVRAISGYSSYAGKRVTVGAWVKAPSTNTLPCFVQIHSASNYVTQLQLANDDEWHYVTISHVVNGSPTDLNIYFFAKAVATANTTNLLYVDDVAMIVGKNQLLRYPVKSSVS